MLTRLRTIKGETTTEVRYAITSLGRDEADADELLKMTRLHWGIENRIFHVRDASMGEDKCRVRTGRSPITLALFRNVTLAILAKRKVKNRQTARRAYAACPLNALAEITEN